jgi:Protein of unknown function (DUF4232)
MLRFPAVRRWHPFVWLGIPLLLAACHASAGGSPSPTPSVAPSAEAGAFTTPCSAEQLSVSLRNGPFSEPTGQNSSTVIITNISSSGCYLFGYPGVAFVESAGHALPFQYQTSGDQVVTSAAPRHVDLSAHSLAYVTVNKYRCDLGDLMQASVLRLAPPGLASSFDVSLAGNIPMDYCGPGDPGSTVYISPVEPNFLATVAH